MIRADADVDSLNTVPWYDLFARPQYDPADHCEDMTNRPCRIIPVNDNDDDHDGIPDFADGYSLIPGASSTVSNADERFTPIVFEISDAVDLTHARVRIDYSESAPMDVTYQSHTNAQGIISYTSLHRPPPDT